MIGILLALLVHNAPADPYHWHMSCERFLTRSYEIRRDDRYSTRQANWLIGYLRSKVDGPCGVIS